MAALIETYYSVRVVPKLNTDNEAHTFQSEFHTLDDALKDAKEDDRCKDGQTISTTVSVGGDCYFPCYHPGKVLYSWYLAGTSTVTFRDCNRIIKTFAFETDEDALRKAKKIEEEIERKSFLRADGSSVYVKKATSATDAEVIYSYIYKRPPYKIVIATVAKKNETFDLRVYGELHKYNCGFKIDYFNCINGFNRDWENIYYGNLKEAVCRANVAGRAIDSFDTKKDQHCVFIQKRKDDDSVEIVYTWIQNLTYPFFTTTVFKTISCVRYEKHCGFLMFQFDNEKDAVKNANELRHHITFEEYENDQDTSSLIIVNKVTAPDKVEQVFSCEPHSCKRTYEIFAYGQGKKLLCCFKHFISQEDAVKKANELKAQGRLETLEIFGIAVYEMIDQVKMEKVFSWLKEEQ